MSQEELINDENDNAPQPLVADDQPVADVAEAEVEEAASADISSPPQPSDPEPDADDSLPKSIFDLKPGLKLAGTVKTITNFGAFVDVGIAQDGLVHVSEVARGRVENVGDVVAVGDQVTVWVKKVDKKRGRISLTMLKPIKNRWRDLKEGAVLSGTVARLEPYGAFVDIKAEREGLVHVSELTHDFIESPEDAVSIGDQVTVKILKVDRKKRQIDLSIKALLPPPQARPKAEKSTVVVDDEVDEEKAATTAMAVAFQAAHGDLPATLKPSRRRAKGKGKRRKRRDLDRLLHRTLEKHPN
ncbi:MAG: S1 RNA-binding domain-containing protein [Anaerolineae bacterium]